MYMESYGEQQDNTMWIFTVITIALAAAIGILVTKKLKPTQPTITIHDGKNITTKNGTPGILYSGGTTATSKEELRLRGDLQQYFELLPRELFLITFEDQQGIRHKLTPDIIIKHPKVVVEYDPSFHHLGKENHDWMRGYLYEQLGYGVVRLRTGDQMEKLGPYDVVDTKKSGYDKKKHLAELVTQINQAKPQPGANINYRFDIRK